jgi:5-methylcytosine-specific restriction endonuclease McrA
MNMQKITNEEFHRLLRDDMSRRLRDSCRRSSKKRAQLMARSPLGILTPARRLVVVKRLIRRQGGGCFWCKAPLPFDRLPYLDGAQLDHYMPLSRGGGHTMTNLRAVCPPCNMKKASKHPDQFWRELVAEFL